MGKTLEGNEDNFLIRERLCFIASDWQHCQGRDRELRMITLGSLHMNVLLRLLLSNCKAASLYDEGLDL